MTKKIFQTAVSAIALIGFAGLVQAQTVTTTTIDQYSAPGIADSQVFVPNGGYGHGHDDNGKWQNVPGETPAQQYNNDHVGSHYHQSATSTGDTETAKQSDGATFQLTGTVNKDCSFYNGTGGSSHQISLGTIGIRTGSGDNVSQAFNQVDDASVNVNTATAGCNFNNVVTINKGHKGLENNTTDSYDHAQFTTEIPYGVTATWTGVDQGGSTTKPQVLTVASTQGAGDYKKPTGAWRSAFNMDISVPKQSLGLVAGTYQDTITVTLAAS